MSERIPGLMGFVIRTLKEEPRITASELLQRSRTRYPEVSGLTVRQFHARYPMQAKKQLNRPVVRLFPVPKPEPPPVPVEPEPQVAESVDEGAPPREELRLLLFRLAMDLETAMTRADVVDVVSRMDRYVDEALSIARRSPAPSA